MYTDEHMDRNVLYTFITVTCIIFLPQVLTNCSSGCTDCRNGNKCHGCQVGMWLNGYVCNICPDNCSSCTDNYYCQSCKPKFWGISCNFNCPDNCAGQGCNAEGNCYACNADWYGIKCYKDCKLCQNEQCNMTHCTYGCKSRFYQFNDGNNSDCRPCPSNCETCLNETFCTQCSTNFYINQFTLSTAGRAQALCVSCLDTSVCSACQNLSKCARCSVIEGNTVCDRCEPSYTLEDGKCYSAVCSMHCRTGCNGLNSCLGECELGYSGTNCGYACLKSNCLKCSKTANSECEICKSGYYTPTCDRQCSQNCLRGNTTCTLQDGYCLNGCILNLWGNTCENLCPLHCQTVEGIPEVCDEHTGTCSHGCKDGFHGLYCNESFAYSQSTMTITNHSENQTSQHTHETSTLSDRDTGNGNAEKINGNKLPVAAIGGGTAGGCVLVAGIIVISVCFVKRRNRKHHEHGHESSITRFETVNPAYDKENLKEDFKAEPGVHSQDYIYAQPNKPKKLPENKKGTKDDSQFKANTTMQIDTETDEETDIDHTVTLEELDDGNNDTGQTVIVSPSSDIYYNTEGLVRSRIQVSKLFDYIRDKRDFLTEFERLPKILTRTCNEALKPQNRAKNRYNGIYSYDATRVVLGSKEYINASHIEGYDNSRSYIASLGPTKITMPQFAVFWEMVWQENTQKIVMLTNLMESGKQKCEKYWPENSSSRQYGPVLVTAKTENVYAEFVVRELFVVKGGETRTVTHYHFTAWPDKSVPETVASLVEFRNMVERKGSMKTGPMIVHCSAGIGRTGTYIALDILTKEGKAENSVDIFGCVNALRGQRVHMVQNVEQYEFLHHCVVYALTCQPELLDLSTLTSFTTGDNMNDQFQAFSNILSLTNKELDDIATNRRRKENRKGSDIPGDLHRVKLGGTKKDYINAVFVDGYLQQNRYILAQTPMPSTLEDFILLLYQKKIGLVVCLDDEDGQDKTKGQYIAPTNKVSKFGQFHVSAESCEINDGFVVRTLKISEIGTSSTNDLKLLHYQFQGWKITDVVPQCLQTFMGLVADVKKQKATENETVLFHCLDGGKKSGLLCAVSIMLEKLTVERELSVINTICQVRGRRRNTIQDFEQFRFCYSCVQNYQETSEAKTYYNIL